MSALRRVIAGWVVLGLVGVVGAPGCRDRTVEVSLDAAIEYEDVKEGTGPRAQEGYLIEAHYVGRLDDGTVVVDTRATGKSHKWIVGDGTVIPGVDAVVRGMRSGGVRVATLPPHAHYGRKGYAGVIPEEAMMTFEIEMLRVSRSGGNPLAWSTPEGP